MDRLSERLGNNQFGTVHTSCTNCNKDFDIELERTGCDSMKISGGQIGVNTKNPDAQLMFQCPNCKGQPMSEDTEIYSRVVGYMRPVSSWNDAKQSEFKLRKPFKMSQ